MCECALASDEDRRRARKRLIEMGKADLPDQMTFGRIYEVNVVSTTND